MIDWIAVLRAVEEKAGRLALDNSKSGIGHVAFVVDRVSTAAADELERQRDAVQGTDEAARTRQPLVGAPDTAHSAPAPIDASTHWFGCGLEGGRRHYECLVGEYDALRAQLAEAKASAACDACAGTGKPISRRPCMCGGTGLASDAVVHLRTKLAEREAELAALRSSERERLIRDACGAWDGGSPIANQMNRLTYYERERRAKETPRPQSGIISEAQGKRLWTIAATRAKALEGVDRAVIVRDVLARRGIEYTVEVPRDAYERIVQEVETWEPPVRAADADDTAARCPDPMDVRDAALALPEEDKP